MTGRIIFMGTPEFSVPALETLVATDVADVALVVTQPDRPAGRGKRLVSPAVKIAADRHGLPVLQTGTLRDPDVRQRIIEVEPDLVVVAAFGMILGKWILELPYRGCINLHASLLPKYRGANPIAAAIAMGEATTGVTLMHMDRGLDTGDMYENAQLDILDSHTTESLTPQLGKLAGHLLQHNLSGLLDGSLKATPQGAGATLTRQMSKDDGWLNFSRSAIELERHVRAMWPWPRAWTTTAGGERVQVHKAGVDSSLGLEPGKVADAGNRVLVGTGDGALELVRILLPGGRPIEGNAMKQSASFAEGQRLGGTDVPGNLPPLVVPVDPS